MPDKFRIAILDDEQVWIEAIVSLLSRAPELEIVGTASSQAEAKTIAQNLRPDLFLVDINLGHAWQNGISATIAILDASPETEVVVLTAAESDQHVVDAISAGAIDFLQKSNCELLLPAILRYMRKEFSPGTILARNFASLRRENIAKSLTDQEYQVLEQLSNNVSRSKIQNNMNKSESTIKSQIRSILHKLGVSRTSEAISKLKHGGVIFPEEENGSETDDEAFTGRGN